MGGDWMALWDCILVPIVVYSERKETDKLCFNPSKYKDGVEIVGVVNYLLLLIKLSQNSNIYDLLLDGFLIVHKTTCYKEDCELKDINQTHLLNKRKIRKNHENEVSDTVFISKELIKQMYVYGIRKFTDCNVMKIEYYFQLLGDAYLKQQALQVFL